MNKNFKKGDGLSIIIIVVVSIVLVIAIMKPALTDLMKNQAIASETVGTKVENVAQKAIKG